jgi:hypothetical protein
LVNSNPGFSKLSPSARIVKKSEFLKIAHRSKEKVYQAMSEKLLALSAKSNTMEVKAAIRVWPVTLLK